MASGKRPKIEKHGKKLIHSNNNSNNNNKIPHNNEEM
jgi:hypothetical protein